MTRYYRNINHPAPVNGLTARQLALTQGSVSEYTEGGGGEWHSIVALLHENGSTTPLHDTGFVAATERTVNGEGIQSASFTPKLTAVQPTDAIRVTEVVGGVNRVFVTAQLGISGHIRPVPWTIHRYTWLEIFEGVDEFGPFEEHVARLYYGSASYNSRIEGIEIAQAEDKYLSAQPAQATAEVGAAQAGNVGGYWVMGAWQEVEYSVPADPVPGIAGLGGMGLGGAPISGAEEIYIRIHAVLAGRGGAGGKANYIATGKATLPGRGQVNVYFTVLSEAILHGSGGLAATGVVFRNAITGKALLVARGSLGAVGAVMKIDNMEFTGQLAPGDTLIIDMQAMTAKINGQNAVHQINGNFFELLPGQNIIEVLEEKAGRKVRLRIDFHDKFL